MNQQQQVNQSEQKLLETRNMIERYKNMISDVEYRLSKTDVLIHTETGIQNLLKFELSDVQRNIKDLKADIIKLEEDQEGLSNELLMSTGFCRFLSLNQDLLGKREEIKDTQIRKMQNQLDTLDFSIEERECNPTRDINSFTQYPSMF